MENTTSASNANNNDEEELRVLEFYSGIGGMHYGLKESGVKFEVVQSFDINTNAILNYKYTFNENTSQKNIESLTVEEIDNFKSNAWLMSPPCQPFTRSGLQKDDLDNRTNSFFHLLDVIGKLKSPPKYILIENVFGFEKSNTRTELVKVLKQLHYSFQEFHLTPQQFDLPNQRLRYFCIAKLNSIFNFQEIEETIIDKKDENVNNINNENNENNNNNDNNDNNDKYKILNYIPGYNHSTLEDCEPLSNYLDTDKTDDEIYQQHKVPEKLLLSKGMLFDIKQKESKTCNCFTKSYGKFVEGTGSIIQIDNEFKADETNPKSLIPMKLRYFTPKEITRLHGFPEEFKFSPQLKTIQCYRLIGNSLNVKIISELVKLLVSK
ncbi:hypothetical protein DICPUDRAFT_153508 [Dictyostelium purpureum]|uniref:DNA (cytosine-5-)-methyltransferase n=2 Tax=Dictyostelium purpureum TaxID=5786 RepID=F0ZP34_DICPU|nr:uncharacterized protein DICPUDRAFT_153508 [Dictyostelium purpureum]EGC34300.1 hypothetical protein DICPUDRAFT_153508 [Dictyostelium purpureum]|eukprot:XP_003289182.1 hypothetical protein DICPUDRAFT_153508 [Dictyostelium purpureum]